MEIADFYYLWDLLSETASSAWSFLTTDVGIAIYNWIEGWAGESYRDIMWYRAIREGYDTPWEYFADGWPDISVLEFALGTGIVFVLGYRLVKWLIDIF